MTRMFFRRPPAGETNSPKNELVVAVRYTHMYICVYVYTVSRLCLHGHGLFSAGRGAETIKIMKSVGD
jgi:hypothetical protein